MYVCDALVFVWIHKLHSTREVRDATNTLPSTQRGARRNEHTPFNTGRRERQRAHSLQHREERDATSKLPTAQRGARRNEHITLVLNEKVSMMNQDGHVSFKISSNLQAT